MLSIHDIEVGRVYEGSSGIRKKVLAIRNRDDKVSGSSVAVFEVLESNPTKRKHHNALSVGTIHTVYIGNFVKSTVLDVTEECMTDMTTGRIAQLAATPLDPRAGVNSILSSGGDSGITVHTKASDYRLCKKASGELVLQGYFAWQSTSGVGGDWKDLPTIAENDNE